METKITSENFVAAAMRTGKSNRSKHTPHQGKCEMERRAKRMGKEAAE